MLEPWPVTDQRFDATELPIERSAAVLGIPVKRLSKYFSADFETRFPTRPLKGRRPTPLWTYTIGDGIHPSMHGAEVGAKAIYSFLKNAES